MISQKTFPRNVQDAVPMSVRLRALWRLTMVAQTLRAAGRAISDDATPKMRALQGHEAAKLLAARAGIKVVVEGQVPPRGTLIVPNHRSYLDSVVVASQLPVAFLAKTEMSTWPIFGPFSKKINTIYLDRDCKVSRRAARKGIAATLINRVSCVVFPEGTTTAAPGCNDFRWGSFEVAAALNAPVCPMAIEFSSTRDAWVGNDTFVNHFFDRMGRSEIEVHVRFGPTIRWMDPRATHGFCENWVRGALDDLHNTLHLPENTDERGPHVPPQISLPVSVPARPAFAG
jgi:1-acyl-sn-glycerol-3-phosphate acyltransferase